MKILLTGFDPFAGEKINPSWEVAQSMKDLSRNNFDLHTVKVPTVFKESAKTVNKAIEDLKPDLVVCLGQAGGRSSISLERIAINVDDARIADNAGNKPVDEPIVPKGPAAYFSTLPLKAMTEAIKNAGVPAQVSNTAGTFVCNHLMYSVLHFLNEKNSSARAGFIHIPFLPEQAAEHGNSPSMGRGTVRRGLEAAFKAANEHKKDIKKEGGRLF